jgi:hypothetical protein
VRDVGIAVPFRTTVRIGLQSGVHYNAFGSTEGSGWQGERPDQARITAQLAPLVGFLVCSLFVHELVKGAADAGRRAGRQRTTGWLPTTSDDIRRHRGLFPTTPDDSRCAVKTKDYERR